MSEIRNNVLDTARTHELVSLLKARFEKNMHRHKDLEWQAIQARLISSADKLWSLYEMERTGGEPDVVGYDNETGAYVFFDCSAESPVGRRNLYYDRAGLESRKEYRPENSAVDMAAAMGVELLDEEQYSLLQGIGKFDTKTSSWLKTPAEVRKHGGAIFGDYRYGRTFVYHNGAQSYYGVRGFRASIRVQNGA